MKSYQVKSFLLFLITLVIGCTKSEHPMVKQLEKSIATAEANLESVEAAIKLASEKNQGLRLKLQQDKQLAISRLERLKENLFSIAPHKRNDSKPAPDEGHGGSH